MAVPPWRSTMVAGLEPKPFTPNRWPIPELDGRIRDDQLIPASRLQDSAMVNWFSWDVRCEQGLDLILVRGRNTGSRWPSNGNESA